jgi:hypothetical protein
MTKAVLHPVGLRKHKQSLRANYYNLPSDLRSCVNEFLSSYEPRGKFNKGYETYVMRRVGPNMKRLLCKKGRPTPVASAFRF